MKNQNQLKFSHFLSEQFNRLKEWLKPDPEDHIALRMIKMILKGVVMLLLLLFSPVLLIGLALVFIGLM